MGEVFHWFSHLHAGKWVTDNTATLGVFLNLLLVLAKWATERKIRKQDKQEKHVENVEQSRTQETLMRKIDQNTAVTVATAQQAGIPIATLLDHIDNGFDELLQRKLASNVRKPEGEDDGQERSGGSRSHN